MSHVKYHVLPNSIVLNFHGKTMSIPRDDKRYDKVLGLIRSGQLADIPAAIDLETMFKGTRMSLVDGVVQIDGDELPNALSKKILLLKEQDLPLDSIVNFWDRLKLNPSFNSRKQLYDFLEFNQHPLTEDGKFIAYRGVTEDFKDIHSKTFDNSVGSVCEMPRDKVDDNPNNTCSFGLHVASHSYAKGFGPKLVEVEVDPADVIAVPTDYNGTKMRVCKFKVIALGENERTEVLYGHIPESVDEETSDDNSEELALIEQEMNEVETSILNFDPRHDSIDYLIEMRDRLERLENEKSFLE